MRHLLSLFELTTEEIVALFERSRGLKEQLAAGRREPLLGGRVLALLFEKPSLRTRVSFETAMAHLGGTSLFLEAKDVGFGKREDIADFAQVLSQYVDAVVIRTFAHEVLEEFAQHSECPLINGLSDFLHPCQALADLFTLEEVFGSLAGRTMAFVGDGNNVARSLAIVCGKLGVRFVLAAPRAYRFSDEFLSRLKEEVPGAEVEETEDPRAAVAGASAVYTDVWASMGQEAEAEARRKTFAPYQVGEKLIEAAGPDARFMHCLPAHRGEEVTDAVLDGRSSIVSQQAANRMHLQKGLLAWLIGADHNVRQSR